MVISTIFLSHRPTNGNTFLGPCIGWWIFMVEKPRHVAWGHVKLKLVTWVVVVPTSNHIGSHILHCCFPSSTIIVGTRCMYHNVRECKVKPTMTLDPHFSDYFSLTFNVFGD